MTLYERAIALLARREHSRAELARKLSPHLNDEENVDTLVTLLDRLVADKLLSDRRYAEVLAHSRAGRHGSLRLRQDLQQQGVSEGDAGSVLASARAADTEACRVVWQKKFGALPQDIKERARQTRFLLGRGFPIHVVNRVVSRGADADADTD